MTVARNADGRLEVFARGTDNALIHIWQTSPGNGWSFWQSLGGFLAGRPAAARNADGRLEVFGRDADGSLVHIWQVEPGSGWSAWDLLGGGLYTDPVLAVNADGRLEIFAIGGGGDLIHNWQVAPSSFWAGWQSLGGDFVDPNAGRGTWLDVLPTGDGRLEVFVVGNDSAMWHIWQTAPNNGWSNWVSHGGVLTSAPAVHRNLDGRLEVFATGKGDIQHKWQTAPGNGWEDWHSLGHPGVPLIDNPALGRNADGRLEVFIRGTDQALWHMWQVTPGGAWSDWESLGGAMENDLVAVVDAAPTVATNADGRLEVFARQDDNSAIHIWQIRPNGTWSSWDRLGGWSVTMTGRGWREL